MEIFNVGNKQVNLYLLNSGTHRLLIDAGFPNEVNELGRAMRSTGFKIRDIDYLIVTHFHVDHAGAIQELKNEGVKFVLFDIQASAIKPMEAMIGGKWKYTPLLLKDNIDLCIDESKQFLKQININGQILSTLGHTNDGISLLLTSGEAFTGDLMRENLIVDNQSSEKISWTKLKQSGAKKIYPSHGEAYLLNEK